MCSVASDLGLMVCTFCGASRDAGARLVQGPGVSICTECAAQALRTERALVLMPGDTSPLAQLVRAAVAMEDAWRKMSQRSPGDACAEYSRFRAALYKAGETVADDPAVREWAAVPAQGVGEVRHA